MSALDPAQQTTETIYDRLGGDAGLRELVGVFYSSIFEDPVLQPVFGSPVATHVDHLTAFLGEVFGGPARYSGELGGFPAIIAVHRGLRITEEQRQRFIALFTAAFERVGLGGDRELREAVMSCIEFGTEVARVNSNATTDNELHPQREMPQWHW
jgi:hemoglobin